MWVRGRDRSDAKVKGTIYPLALQLVFHTGNAVGFLRLVIGHIGKEAAQVVVAGVVVRIGRFGFLEDLGPMEELQQVLLVTAIRGTGFQ